VRIGINAYFLRHPNTGSGQYLTRLVEAFNELSPADEIALFSPRFSSLSANLDKLWFEQIALPRAGAAARLVLRYV